MRRLLKTALQLLGTDMASCQVKHIRVKLESKGPKSNTGFFGKRGWGGDESGFRIFPKCKVKVDIECFS